jgi:hypothetical protein
MTEGSKPNNNQGSSNNNRKPNNKNRNRNRNRNRNKKAGTKKPIDAKQEQPRKKVKLFGADKIIAKYDNLNELHQLARKKLYEMFFRSNKDQKRKLNDKFNSTLKGVRDYETGLKDWEKEALDKRIDGYPMDTTYTTNNNIPVDLKDPEPEEIKDEHVNQVQHDRPDYTNDKDESEGAMEDYYTFKGISPPAPPEVKKVDEAKK